MRAITLILLIILLIPSASALTANTSLYRLDFVIKPSTENSESNIVSVINPIAGAKTGANLYQGFLFDIIEVMIAEAPAAEGGAVLGAGAISTQTYIDQQVNQTALLEKVEDKLDREVRTRRLLLAANVALVLALSFVMTSSEREKRRLYYPPIREKPRVIKEEQEKKKKEQENNRKLYK